ncbi:hypothetical protein [Bartonella sp. LJL80]
MSKGRRHSLRHLSKAKASRVIQGERLRAEGVELLIEGLNMLLAGLQEALDQSMSFNRAIYGTGMNMFDRIEALHADQ